MNQPSTLKERILQYAQVHLGAEPEHLWAKFPRYAVLRHSENAKWFAVFLEVPGNQVGLEMTESVDILDVKCGPAPWTWLPFSPASQASCRLPHEQVQLGHPPPGRLAPGGGDHPPAGTELRSDEAGCPASQGGRSRRRVLPCSIRRISPGPAMQLRFSRREDVGGMQPVSHLLLRCAPGGRPGRSAG